jgi:hypothetical protein
MAISLARISHAPLPRKSFHLHQNFGSRTFARPKNYRTLGRSTRGRATALRIALEAELTSAEPAGRKRRGCARDDQQRHRLLPIPIHVLTIT